MTMGEIKDKAKNLGITPGNMKKTELIRPFRVPKATTPATARQTGPASGQSAASEPTA